MIRLVCVSTLAAVAMIANVTADEAPSPAAPAIAAPATPVMTKEDIETFFDGYIPYALNRGDIAGATLSVVKDGQLLFAKGYGLADLKSRKPVSADETLFRPGSVSKLFTWTAVMQQVEAGKLDLDADINKYLDFKIPDAFGAPITLRHIMTHTAGFEEVVRDLFVGKPEDVYPIGDYLKNHIPARIFAPGKTVAYSNYATTIAGYIVERVSGETFDNYIANHIFKPLGMTHSTFAQPLPADLASMLSTGYQSAGQGKPVEFELIEPGPAGSLTSSAPDMAKFMIAHLGDGGQGAARILKAETLAQMHAFNHGSAPGLDGFALGFYENSRNGHRVIGHAGDTVAFHSDLELVLDANVGIFISFNSPGKEGDAGHIRFAVYQAFMDRYFPAALSVDAKFDTAKLDAKRVVGSYWPSRRKETALLLLSIFGQASVTADENGDVRVDALKDYGGSPKAWRQIAPLRYREVGGAAQLVFVADEKSGAIEYFTTDDFPPVMVFQRTPGLLQAATIIPATIGGIGVLVVTLLVWIFGAFTRWRHSASLEMTSRQFMLRLASRTGVLLLLGVVVGWVGFLAAVGIDQTILFSASLTGILQALYAVGVAAMVGGVAMIANAAARLVGGPGGIFSRLGEVVIGATGLFGIWVVYYFGLANFVTQI